MKPAEPILVIGGTGYIGGRLVPLLLESGNRVRVLGRSLAKLSSRPWASHPRIEAVQGDVLNREDLKRAVEGCRAAYYLVSFANDPGLRGIEYKRSEVRAAFNMVSASSGTSLERIISLGWLGDSTGSKIGGEQRARSIAVEILGSGPVPLTHLRTPVVFGSGSAFFEIVRYLAERQPVVPAPPWMKAPIQPISIRNVLNYLVGCLENEETTGRTFDIGGPEVLTFERLIKIYAEIAGLRKRWVFSAPFISPASSALWIHLVTPIPLGVVKPIAETLSSGAVCRDDRIRSIIVQELIDSREGTRRALDKTLHHRVEACWTDAGALVPPEWTYCGDEQYAGGTVFECGYSIRLRASAEEIWSQIVRIGGQNGWYYGESLWQIRGWLDKLFGGTSLHRGRRHPYDLHIGDALDFWRVLELSSPSHLLLLSEMKLPGEAILEFKIIPLPGEETELRQLSRFVPRGFPGLLYWYVLYPAHQWLFRGMLRAIARAIRKPVTRGPQRFTPKIQPLCKVHT
jgi:uncharacterized protein YbjT (DUF2867 family)